MAPELPSEGPRGTDTDILGVQVPHAAGKEAAVKVTQQ